MKQVEPKVYCIAETQLNDFELRQWLEDNKWEECLKHMGPASSSEILAELVGRRCYRSFKVGGENSNPNVTKIRQNSKEYINNILQSLHGSVLEHVTSTWAFENVSRVMTHELVRHGDGTAFSQESQRYVRLNEIFYWLPPEIEENQQLKAVFEDVANSLEKAQLLMAEICDIDNIPNFGSKKRLTSAFRRIAPEGVATGIVATFNMRALRWILEMRTSVHAEAEMRLVFDKVGQIAQRRWPFFFQDFERINTNDGFYEWTPKYHKV